MKNFSYLNSPIGLIEIVASEKEILEISFVKKKKKNCQSNRLSEKGQKQLSEYFAGNG